jgi:hypothetical protein
LFTNDSGGGVVGVYGGEMPGCAVGWTGVADVTADVGLRRLLFLDFWAEAQQFSSSVLCCCLPVLAVFRLLHTVASDARDAPVVMIEFTIE